MRSDGGAAMDEGHLIVRALFMKFTAISNQAIRKEIVQAITNPPAWRTTIDSFRGPAYKAPFNVWKFFSDDNSRPS